MKRPSTAKQALVGRVDGVRGVGECEKVFMAGMAVRLLQFFGAGEGGKRVGNQARAYHGAKPHFIGNLEGGVRHPVHVIEEDRAGADHFLGGEANAAAHIVLRELCLEWPDVLV